MRRLLPALLLAACDAATEPGAPAVAPERPRPQFVHEQHGEPQREPPSAKPVLLHHELLAADPFAPRPASPRGPWIEGIHEWSFVTTMLLLDADAYWLQSNRNTVLRIPRDRDLRWIRDDIPCPGSLLGERDDLLYCYTYNDQWTEGYEDLEGTTITIYAVDKSGFGPPAVVAALPWLQAHPTGLGIGVWRQGPFIVGDRVMMPIDAGFVSAALDGDGTLEFLELGHRPHDPAVSGDRVAWTTPDRHALYAGEVPLTTIRRAHADQLATLWPAWAGDSLLIRETTLAKTRLLRLTADRRTLVLAETTDPAADLEGDGERAWWSADDRVMWIDPTAHGPAYWPSRPASYGQGFTRGIIAWETFAHGGSAIYVSDGVGGPVASLCGPDCAAAVARDPAAHAAFRRGKTLRPPTTHAYLRDIQITGAAVVEPMYEVLHDRTADVDACYERAVAEYPDLEGMLVTRFEVDRKGRVQRPALAAESQLTGPALRDCVFARMRRWRFPPGAGPVTIVAPFELVVD